MYYEVLYYRETEVLWLNWVIIHYEVLYKYFIWSIIYEVSCIMWYYIIENLRYYGETEVLCIMRYYI